MKRYLPRKPAHHARVPAFVPVATRARKDGWTARRQAAFLAALAITGSVGAAARGVSMARETAYRLRRREGAESFAAAWDAILGRCIGAERKVTPDERARRAIEGLLKPVIYRGRHVANQRKPDNSALLRYLAQLDRGQGSALRERERSQGFAHRSASAVEDPPRFSAGQMGRGTAREAGGGGVSGTARTPPSGPACQPPPHLPLRQAQGKMERSDDVRGTPPDTPDRTRTALPSPAYRAAARSGGIRR